MCVWHDNFTFNDPIAPPIIWGISRLTTSSTHYFFIFLDDLGPPAPDTKPDYSSPQDREIDLVLEVGVENIGYNLEREKGPLISFFMISHISAILRHALFELSSAGAAGVSKYTPRIFNRRPPTL